MLLLCRCTSVSKKLKEVLDFSIVNLIVSCTLLRCVVNFSSSSSPCCQRQKISSMFLFEVFHEDIGI